MLNEKEAAFQKALIAVAGRKQRVSVVLPPSLFDEVLPFSCTMMRMGDPIQHFYICDRVEAKLIRGDDSVTAITRAHKGIL